MKKTALAIAIVLGAAAFMSVGCGHTHEFGNYYTLKPATCISEGEERRDCKVCEFYQTRKIPLTDHTLSDYSADKSYHWKECSVCHQHFEKGPHTFGTDDDENVKSICSVCKYDTRGSSGLGYRLSSDGKYYIVDSLSGVIPQSVTIPETYFSLPVKEIAARAFKGDTFTSISLPDGLVTIGEEAFAECASLEKIVLPDTVTKVGKGAFKECTALGELTLPFTWMNGLTVPSVVDEDRIVGDSLIGYLFGADLYLGNPSFVPESLTKVEFTGGTVLNKYCFWGCAHLKQVVLPSTLQTVEVGVFENCSSLETLAIPAKVTRFEMDSALTGCTSLKEITVAPENTAYMAQDGILYDSAKSAMVVPAKIVGEITIPEGVKTLPASAFGGSGIVSIALPSTVTAIGERCFEKCAALATVTILDDGRLAVFGDYSFADCVSLTEIKIPASVTRIGLMAFSGSGLTRAYFAEKNGWGYLDPANGQRTPANPGAPDAAAQQLKGGRVWTKI